MVKAGNAAFVKRIVIYPADSPNAALLKAKLLGKAEEYSERRDEVDIYFEFVGVMELQDITTNFADGEVWSELQEMVEPMERREGYCLMNQN